MSGEIPPLDPGLFGEAYLSGEIPPPGPFSEPYFDPSVHQQPFLHYQDTVFPTDETPSLAINEPTEQLSPPPPSPANKPARLASLTKEETNQAVRHARDELMKVTITRGAIFGSNDSRDSEIKKAIRKGLRSVVGAAEVQQPKTMRKDVVRCLNELLHGWKGAALMCALASLQRGYDHPVPSRTAIVDKAKDLLRTFSFLQASPEDDYFTAATFHQIIVHRVFECKPELWIHIDVNAPHNALDNMFALGAAAIAANVRDYQFGGREEREVSLENWMLDFHEARTLIGVIRRDAVRQAALDELQRWMMELGMNIVTHI